MHYVLVLILHYTIFELDIREVEYVLQTNQCRLMTKGTVWRLETIFITVCFIDTEIGI